MYLRWGVVSSLPSATHDILDHQKDKVFSGLTWCIRTPITSHIATVQEGGAGNQYLLRMGKHVGPAPVVRKCRHDSILLRLTGGRRQAKWKDMGGLSAKDKLTSQELY
jgi:hypothetical protein